MQPKPAGRQRVGFGGKARRDEPGRQGTLQHVETNRIGQGRFQCRESPAEATTRNKRPAYTCPRLLPRAAVLSERSMLRAFGRPPSRGDGVRAAQGLWITGIIKNLQRQSWTR